MNTTDSHETAGTSDAAWPAWAGLGSFSPARAREDLVMRVLARVVDGDGDAAMADSGLPLRQLGYAAALVEGCLDDPEGHLRALIRKASSSPAGEEPAGGYADPVQARWQAPWHMEARRLRLETPAKLMTLRLQGGGR